MRIFIRIKHNFQSIHTKVDIKNWIADWLLYFEMGLYANL